jgi:hypothetical protein
VGIGSRALRLHRFWGDRAGVRINALYLAIILMIAALLPRWWAKADLSGSDYRGGSFVSVTEGVEIGVLNGYEFHNSESRVTQLHDFDGIDAAGEDEGLMCLVAGIASILTFVIASIQLERSRWSRQTQIMHAIPIAVSLIATCTFAHRLAGVGYMHLSWSVFFALASVGLGGAAILVPRPPPAGPIIPRATASERT